MLHVQYISPLLRKHEGVIDNALEEGLRKGEATLLEFRTRSERYFRVRHVAHDVAAWCARGPELTS